MPTVLESLPYLFENRLNKHHFQANPPKIDVLEDLLIVSSVLDREKQVKFKSSEERLLFRVEEWIKECTVPLVPSNAKLPVDDMGLTSEGSKKPATEKRDNTRRLGRMLSRSLSNLDAFRSEDMAVFREERNKLQAKSTDDLRRATKVEMEQVVHKYGTLPRSKLKVPWFNSKDLNEDNNEKSSKKKTGNIAKRILYRKKKSVDENANDVPAKFISGFSKVAKHRPSLFNMADLKTDGKVNTDIESDGDCDEEHGIEEPGQGKTFGSTRGHQKFLTGNGLDVKDNVFKTSIRISATSTRQARSCVTADALFYSPEPKKTTREKEMGLI